MNNERATFFGNVKKSKKKQEEESWMSVQLLFCTDLSYTTATARTATTYIAMYHENFPLLLKNGFLLPLLKKKIFLL